MHARGLPQDVTSTPPRASLRLLGAPELRLNGRPLRITCERKVLELIAFVATATSLRRQRGEIAAALWPELQPSDGRAALRRHLHYLDRALAGNVELLRREGSALVLQSDAVEFDLPNLAPAGASADREPNSPLEAAGEFLEGYDAEWIPAARASVRESTRAALERSVAAAIAVGDAAIALHRAKLVLRFEPLDESALLRVMELLAQSGDRTAAMREYQQFQRSLRAGLGVDPAPECVAAYRRLRERSQAAHGLHGWPNELTSFIGRADAVDDLLESLATHRLVSCVGPPGIGKTRLALRAGRNYAQRAGVPAIFVDLAHCSDEPGVREALAAAARGAFSGLAIASAPLERFADRTCLVIFDNCEQVTAATGTVAQELLGRGPEIRVLLTSRRRLRIYGEAVRELKPLPLEQAIELFYDRAQLVRPALRGSGRVTPSIREICTRAGGIPLAIELTAARLRTITIAQLAAEAQKQFKTLRSTFDSSVELLDYDSARLFRRLAVFRDGFTLDAAAALSDAPTAATAELLTNLVDHSLVIAPEPEADQPRFSLIQPLREYAFQLLQSEGEAGDLREQHARFFAQHYADRDAELNGERAETYAPEIAAEHGNIVAALELLVAERADVDLAARLCLALQYAWFVTGRVVEGSRWVDRLLASAQIRGEQRNRLLFMRAVMARQQSDYRAAIGRYREAIELRRAMGDDANVAKALVHLSGCLSATGETIEAIACAREAGRYFAGAGDTYFSGYVAMALALASLRSGDLDEAESAFRSGLREFTAGGFEVDVAGALCNLGACALSRGHLESARALSGESLERAEGAGAPFVAAAARLTLAIVAAESGDLVQARADAGSALQIALDTNDHERVAELLEVGARIAFASDFAEAAAQLFGAADSLRERCGAARMPLDARALAHIAEAIRAQIGPQRFEAARLRGLSLSYDGALATLQRIIAPAD